MRPGAGPPSPHGLTSATLAAATRMRTWHPLWRGGDGLDALPNAFYAMAVVLIERGEIMRITSLAMYVSPPPLAAATATLWAFLRDDLRCEGLTDVPDRLDAALHHADAWLHPALLLAQTCGYPYVRHQRGKVRLVATPVYGHPGCDGADMCSFIIVRADGPVRSLEDLRGDTGRHQRSRQQFRNKPVARGDRPPQQRWPVLLICC